LQTFEGIRLSIYFSSVVTLQNSRWCLTIFFFFTVVILMCLPNPYKIYVSVKHNNLLHKIMLTATCFDSNDSSSGHPKN